MKVEIGKAIVNTTIELQAENREETRLLERLRVALLDRSAKISRFKVQDRSNTLPIFIDNE